MPRRLILTATERQTLLALPTHEATLIRHWSLDEEDLALLDTRRRDDTGSAWRHRWKLPCRADFLAQVVDLLRPAISEPTNPG